MARKNRLRDFDYDMDEFIGALVHLCFMMGISEVLVELSMLEMDVLEKYCKGMIHVAEEYSTTLPEGQCMIYYNGKKLKFKPE